MKVRIDDFKPGTVAYGIGPDEVNGWFARKFAVIGKVVLTSGWNVIVIPENSERECLYNGGRYAPNAFTFNGFRNSGPERPEDWEIPFLFPSEEAMTDFQDIWELWNKIERKLTPLFYMNLDRNQSEALLKILEGM